MSVPPRLPNLAPKDMQWIRYVNDQLKKLTVSHEVLKSNVVASSTQRQATQTAVANTVEQAAPVLGSVSVPTAAPQVPVAPRLVTDHATVTIFWSGYLYATLNYVPTANEDTAPQVSPKAGFNRVNVYRSNTQNGTYNLINYITTGATSVVDANVQVGSTYWYKFATVDNLGAQSDYGPPASIVVQGVNLGALDQEVTNAISAANAAGVAGQNAAAAAQQAASTADAKAADALNNAAIAQQRAEDAASAAESATGTQQIYIGVTQPQDTSGNVLWIDTTNNTNTPKRYLNGKWQTLTDKVAIDAANAAVNAQNIAQSAQNTANSAVNTANSALNKATVAQQTADGKNKVTYSVDVPTGSATKNDIWFRYSGNIVIGQYTYDGASWVTKQLDNQIIANLDAGKITSGIISADRIGANSISAQKIIAGSITADSGVLADAVITTAKIADLAVSSAKIANLDAAKIQAGTITTDKLNAGAVTTEKLAVNAIDANRIQAGAVTTAKLSATAIDGITITGAVFRTSATATQNGVVLNSTGIRGYKNSAQTFSVDNNGAVSLTGYVNATGGNFTGYINAQSGYVSGTLLVNGQLVTSNSNPRTVLDSKGITQYAKDNQRMTFGDDGGGRTINWFDQDGNYSAQFGVDSDKGAGDMGIVANSYYVNAGAGGEFIMDTDSTGPYIRSGTIREREYSSNNRTDPAVNKIVVVSQYGTMGALTGVISSNYTSSSSRRFKHDIEDWRPDVTKLLNLNPVRFKYNDGDGSWRVGMIAEQMDELGFSELVSKNDNGDIQTIEYLYFGAALLHVAREQQKQIDELMQRLQEANI